MKLKIWHKFIHPITHYFRKKRGRLLKQYFPNINNYRICDIGGSIHFWEKTELGINPENITLYNISEFETNSMEASSGIQYKIILFDGKNIPESDDAYDLVVCNSVIEHVPEKQRASFVREINRVGKNLFLQTPAFEFPIEPHFVMPFMHWFPRKLGRVIANISIWRLLSLPDKKTIDEYYWGTSLLGKHDIDRLFNGCVVLREKFFGLKKSYIVLCKKTNT